MCALWCWFIACTHVPTLPRPVPDLRIGFVCGQPQVHHNAAIAIYVVSLALDIALVAVTTSTIMRGIVTAPKHAHAHAHSHSRSRSRSRSRPRHVAAARFLHLHSGEDAATAGGDGDDDTGDGAAPAPAPLSAKPSPGEGTLRRFGRLSFITRRFLTDVLKYFAITAAIELFAIVWSSLYLARPHAYNALRATLILCVHSFLGFVIGASPLPPSCVRACVPAAAQRHTAGTAPAVACRHQCDTNASTGTGTGTPSARA